MRKLTCAALLPLFFLIASVSSSPAMQAQTVTELSCPGSEIPLTIRLEGGYVWGKSFERVYLPDEGDRKGSDLIWQLKNVYMLGGVVNVEPVPWLRINLGGWFAVNRGTGIMDDYDWIVEDTSEWSDWSHSDISLKRGIMLDANMQGRLFEYQGLGFWVGGGFKYMNWHWQDRGRFHIYSDEGFRDDYGPDGGARGIDYEQWFYTPYAGVNLTYDYGRLHLSGYLNYSPLSWASDEDNHVQRGMVSVSTFNHIRYLGVGVRATFDVTEHFFVGAGFDFQQYSSTKGTMEVTEDGESDVLPEAAGIEHFTHMVSMTIGYRF